MKVFFTHTDQESQSSCKQNGEVDASTSSLSLAESGEPSAVLSVAKLGAPHTEPRGDDPGETRASGQSAPRGDDPGETKASGKSAASTGTGKKVNMGIEHIVTGMVHIPGGTTGQPCGLKCTAAVTIVCPFPCTERRQTSDKRESLIRSNNLTCPKAVSLNSRSKCTRKRRFKLERVIPPALAC